MSCTNKKKILEIEELSVSFLQYKGKTSRQSWLPVISGLSVAVREGELVAVVGSSGSGKSLLAHAILGILPYNAKVSGITPVKPGQKLNWIANLDQSWVGVDIWSVWQPR